MPIAFDPPTHAPHGTLPSHGRRAAEDDPATLDIFTQLLLAAASLQDPAAPVDPTAVPAQGDAKAADPPILTLPLPVPIVATSAPAAGSVTIVAREKMVDVGASQGSVPRAALGPSSRSTLPMAGQPAQKSATLPATPAPAAEAKRAPTLPSATIMSSPPTPVANPAPLTSAATPTALPDVSRDAPPARALPSAVATLAALLAPSAANFVVPSSVTKPTETLPASLAAAVAAPAPVVPAPVHVETISAPAFTPGWQDETVNKLAEIVLTRTERAELKLHPAELGPVNVRVELRADQVSVQIVAASPETRSALEQSLPQLRDLLASQGITLGQATVHDGAAQRDNRPGAWAASPTPTGEAPEPAARSDAVHLTLRRPDRLVDVFA